MKKKEKQHKTSVGGQALIEGIMMKGPRGTAMSVRLPSGEIETEYKEVNFSEFRWYAGWSASRNLWSRAINT